MPSETGQHDRADLTLRRAGPADREVLAELFIAAREAAFPAMPRSLHGPTSVHAWFGELLDERDGSPPARETWVGVGATDVLGYLVLDGTWLDSLYVRPDRTGEGIGTALLDLAKGLRPDGFSLWVFESNVRARTFYERHGLLTLRRTDGSGNEEHSPDREMAWLGRNPVLALRRRIDEADDRLADVLEQRSVLTALIQGYKEVPGRAGRDVDREREIVARMAAAAPRLGPDRLARIMEVVITEGLDAAGP